MIEPADIVDGSLNLVGMNFSIIAIIACSIIFFRKRKISHVIILIIAFGGMLYTLANVIDK